MLYNIDYIVQTFLFCQLANFINLLNLHLHFSKFGWQTCAFSLAKLSATYDSLLHKIKQGSVQDYTKTHMLPRGIFWEYLLWFLLSL